MSKTCRELNKDKLLYSGLLHMDMLVFADHQKLTFIHYVGTDNNLKDMLSTIADIGTDGKSVSKESMMSVCHNDENEI